MDSDLVSFPLAVVSLARWGAASIFAKCKSFINEPEISMWVAGRNNNNSKTIDRTKKCPVNGQFLRTAVNIQSTEMSNRQHTQIQSSACDDVEREKIYVRFVIFYEIEEQKEKSRLSSN